MTDAPADTPAATTSTNADPDSVRVWDAGVRLFHWSLVTAIALAFLSADPNSAFADLHIAVGWVAAVLITFRVAWGFVGGEHARFADFIRPSRIIPHLLGLLRLKPERTLGHNPLGGLAVLALMGTVVATVVTGVAIADYGDLHATIGWALLALVGVHVLAVLTMSMLSEDLLSAMLSGSKAADLHPGARDARPPIRLGWPIAIGAAVGMVIVALLIDPRAFSPQPLTGATPAAAQATPTP